MSRRRRQAVAERREHKTVARACGMPLRVLNDIAREHRRHIRADAERMYWEALTLGRVTLSPTE